MDKVEKRIAEAAKYSINHKELSLTRVSREFNLDRHTLSKYLKLNLSSSMLVEHEDCYYLFDDREIEAVNEYVSSRSNFSDIKRKFGYKNETFKKKLVILGYSSERKFSMEFDRTKFSRVETESDAYFLGFILADGYINEGRGFLSVKVSERDKDILVKLCNYFGCSEDSIKTFLNSKSLKMQCSLTINSRSVVNNLKNLGLFQGKSCREVPYYDIDESLLRHYIRGIFDGDGFIKKRGNCLGLCGSLETLKFVKSCLDRVSSNGAGNNNVRFDASSNIYRLDYNNLNNFLTILNYLYGECSVYLARKYRLYQQKITELNCRE